MTSIVYEREEAFEHGIEAAILLEAMRRWSLVHGVNGFGLCDGRVWVRGSCRSFADFFGGITKFKMLSVMNYLSDADLMWSRTFQETGQKAKYYSVMDFDKLDQIMAGYQSLWEQEWPATGHYDPDNGRPPVIMKPIQEYDFYFWLISNQGILYNSLPNTHYIRARDLYNIIYISKYYLLSNIKSVFYIKEKKINTKKKKTPELSPENERKRINAVERCTEFFSFFKTKSPNPKSGSETLPADTTPVGRSNRFDDFIRNYPKRQRVHIARKVWIEMDLDDMLHAIFRDIMYRQEKGDWKDIDEKYIPSPDKYLSERRWEDNLSEI